MFDKIFAYALTLIFLMFCHVHAQEFEVIKKNQTKIFFKAPIEAGAIELSNQYPSIKQSLEKLFGWELDPNLSIVLISHRAEFLKIAQNPLIVAFANPLKKLIVIDYSQMRVRPFRLATTLKHELCHLLLHQHIKNIPRWLDEGLCQWASGGIDEIIINQKGMLLNRSALSKNLIPFYKLNLNFPKNEIGLLLAYEQSKSFVDYFAREFGKEKFIFFLNAMKGGDSVEYAAHKAYSMPLKEIEEKWRKSLEKTWRWLLFLSYHLYDILFAFMALITIYAFIKMIIKKKNYQDQPEDDDYEDDDYYDNDGRFNP